MQKKNYQKVKSISKTGRAAQQAESCVHNNLKYEKQLKLVYSSILGDASYN